MTLFRSNWWCFAKQSGGLRSWNTVSRKCYDRCSWPSPWKGSVTLLQVVSVFHPRSTFLPLPLWNVRTKFQITAAGASEDTVSGRIDALSSRPKTGQKIRFQNDKTRGQIVWTDSILYYRDGMTRLGLTPAWHKWGFGGRKWTHEVLTGRVGFSFG